MNLKFTTRGVPEVRAWLQRIRIGFRNQALLAWSQYVVGDAPSGNFWHGLKHYPYYKYVTRQAGFPELGYEGKNGWVIGYASAKQHRYVMAANAEGRITPGVENRSMAFQGGWRYEPGANSMRIVNSTPYGGYLMGDEQTRMANLIGWRRWPDIIMSNINGAMQYAERQVKQWIAEQKA